MSKHGTVAEEVTKIVNRVFGEENVSVQSSSIEHIYTVKFPELTITNTQELSHTIYDLYVRFNLKSARLGGIFQGTRGKLTQIEVTSNYAHSHLPASALDGWQTFCKGDGNFNTVQANLQLADWIKVEFDETQGKDIQKLNEQTLLIFEGWLFEMINFVSWESLASRPHRYISDIGSGAGIYNPTEDDYRISFLRFLKEADWSKIKFELNGEQHVIIEDEEFLEECTRCATIFQFRNEDGSLYSIPKIVRPGKRIANLLKFKDQIISQEVIADSSSENFLERRKLYIHKDVLNHIKAKIADELRKSEVNIRRKYEREAAENRIRRVRDTYHQREVLPENLVPVSND